MHVYRAPTEKRTLNLRLTPVNFLVRPLKLKVFHKVASLTQIIWSEVLPFMSRERITYWIKAFCLCYWCCVYIITWHNKVNSMWKIPNMSTAQLPMIDRLDGREGTSFASVWFPFIHCDVGWSWELWRILNGKWKREKDRRVDCLTSASGRIQKEKLCSEAYTPWNTPVLLLFIGLRALRSVIIDYVSKFECFIWLSIDTHTF